MTGRSMVPAGSLLSTGDIPISRLASLANRESRRPRAIYTAHRWFARRLGSAFRALLIAASTTDSDEFWSRFYGDADLTGWTVLDPFVGGGTSLFEASRLGAEVVGRDVDAVAKAVVEFELSAVALYDTEEILEDLRAAVGDRIATFHRVDGCAAIHHFWVQVVSCLSCGESFDAHPDLHLAFDEESGRQWVVCPDCGEVAQRPAWADTFRCCGVRRSIDIGTVEHGTAICPACGDRAPLIDHGRERGRPSFRLFAAEVTETEPVQSRAVPMRDRFFVSAGHGALAAYADAEKALRRLNHDGRSKLPAMPIRAHDRSDTRVIAYGYRDFSELFNDRQMLHLRLLLEAIKDLPPAKRRVAALAFSAHLPANCMLASYAAGWRRLSPAFALRAYRHIPRPVEVNPWARRTGRGTFPNTLEAFGRAAEFARMPREPRARGGFVEVPSRPAASSRVSCGDAADLSDVADASIDLVLTDPPYFDNISYDELSDFFRPWCEMLGLTKRVERRQLGNALRARRGNAESRNEFAARLGDAFSEIQRVLKPGGLAAFTYQHSTADGWLALADAIATTNLRPCTVFPLAGNGDVGLHASEGASTYDAVIVLRADVRSTQKTGALHVAPLAVTEARRQAAGYRKRLRRASRPFSSADERNLRCALLVASALQDRRRAGVGLDAALSEVSARRTTAAA